MQIELGLKLGQICFLMEGNIIFTGGGMLAGIISSVAVAVVGAVSSFIAYQKKKLCFKASGEFIFLLLFLALRCFP